MNKFYSSEDFVKILENNARNDGIERLLVGAFVFFAGKILIIKRAMDDDFLPGYYEVPGGRIEKNENIIEGLVRELKEETSLEPDKIIKYIDHFDVISPDGKKARQFNFLIKPINDNVILSSEHSSFFWHKIEDKQALLNPMIEPVKAILKKIIHQIEKDPSI